MTPSSAFLDGDDLLSQFFDFREDVKIRVGLTDDANNPLPSDTITVTESSSNRFTKFNGCPARSDGSVLDTCHYQSTLTSDSFSRTSTNVDLSVFRQS